MQALVNSEYFGILIGLIVGQAAPFLISFLKDVKWTDRQKMLLTMFLCACIGTLTALTENALKVNGTFTLDDWLKNVLAVYSSSVAAYKLWFAPTDTNKTLEKIGPFADTALPTVAPPAPPAPPQV